MDILNKKIADFMEVPKCDRCDHCCDCYKYGAGVYYHVFEMKYHTSWDWQIPVWAKINEWFNSLPHLTEDQFQILLLCYRDEYGIGVRNNNMDYCYKILINAIEWYSSSKNKS